MNTLHIFFLGYGHIAPKTPIAKIVTIFYAILGIPLTVLCWSNIGDAMANSFRFCYWRICCYVCTKKPKKRKRRATSRGRGYNIFSNQYLHIYTNINNVWYFFGYLFFLSYAYLIHCKAAQHGGIPELDLYDARIEQVDLPIQSLTVLIPTPYQILTGIYCLKWR